jgi:rubredoxin
MKVWVFDGFFDVPLPGDLSIKEATDMARFRCRECGAEGEFEYRPGARKCPRCGASDVQVAISVMELPADDPLWERLINLGNEAPAQSDEKKDQ